MLINAEKLESMSQKHIDSLVERVESMQTESAKAMMLLNSAAVAAMLAFVQALLGKTDPSLIVTFKPYAISALALFLLGALCSAFNFQLRGWSIFQQLAIGEKNWSGVTSMLMLVISPFCFFIGSTIVVFGITFAL